MIFGEAIGLNDQNIMPVLTSRIFRKKTGLSNYNVVPAVVMRRYIQDIWDVTGLNVHYVVFAVSDEKVWKMASWLFLSNPLWVTASSAHFIL